MHATEYTLSDDQARRAHEAAGRSLGFLDAREYPLGAATVRHHFADGPASDVIAALAAYQYADGGFGNGLEVDIAAPVSNPFATRLALQVLLSLRETPATDLVDRVAGWLNGTQREDGDWHFAAEVYQAPLAPWFQGWTFPALNPACCLAGLGNALGLLSGTTLARTASLFAAQASLAAARSGAFYDVLPYVEYFRSVEHPERDAYLDAIAANIVDTASSGGYEDAGHFLDHALGAGPDLRRRLPATLVSEQVDRLLSEQQPDGGWPTPYDDAWRPHATAAAMMTLAALRA